MNQVNITERKSYFNLTKYLDREYNDMFLNDKIPKNSKQLYNVINALATLAKHGQESSKIKLLAIACHMYNPYYVTQKYGFYNTTVDDITQIICMAVLNALNKFDYKYEFSGYMKQWILGELKKEKSKCLPYKIPRNCKNLELITTISVSDKMFTDENRSDLTIADKKEQSINDIEKKIMLDDFIEKLFSVLGEDGKLLIYYYSLSEPDMEVKRTVKDVEKKFNLTPKQVNLRIMKAKAEFKRLYPNYYEDYDYDVA